MSFAFVSFWLQDEMHNDVSVRVKETSACVLYD